MKTNSTMFVRGEDAVNFDKFTIESDGTNSAVFQFGEGTGIIFIDIEGLREMIDTLRHLEVDFANANNAPKVEQDYPDEAYI
jgi:hypothetical protein